MKRLISFTVFGLFLFGITTISLRSTEADAKRITFTKDVAPIIFNNCTRCHRAGEVGPMPLTSYKEVRPWAKSIREKVIEGVMPPWHASEPRGTFKNDRRLSKDQIDTIVKWIDAGAIEGDPKDLPPLPRFTEGWQIGKPDVVLTMGKEFNVPASGVVDYQYALIPTNFTDDRWIQAAEVRPGNRAVVHHVLVFVAPSLRELMSRPGGFRAAFSEGLIDGLTGTAPGEEPQTYPEGVGKLVKAGSTLVLQMHYTPNGTAQTDRTAVGLIFCKKPPQKAAAGGAAINRRFAIPPGNDNYEVKSSYVFREDAHLDSLMPHMHLRGKDFQYVLNYPDGRSRIILAVPKYDFGWQTRYEFREPIAVPKGARLDCIAHFDNSAKNKFNPDPTRVVRWGPQTFDEMMIGFVGFTRDGRAQSDTASK